MRNKKGFTLIELLGVLVLLAVIALISFIVIDKNLKSNKEKMYNTQIETIELAAKNWGADHLDALPTGAHQMAVTLNTLKIGGYVDNNISNPINGKCFVNTTKVNIINKQGVYKYEIDDDSINFADNCDIFSEDTPIVDITVSTSDIGSNMTGHFVITSNYPFVTDNQTELLSYIMLERECNATEDICEAGTPSVLKAVSQPISLPNGYDLVVDFQSGNIDEHVWLKVAEGISKNETANKISAEVESDRILVDGISPKAELIKAKSELLYDSLGYNFSTVGGANAYYYNMSSIADVPAGITGINMQYSAGYKIVFKAEDVYKVNRIIGTEKEEIFNYEDKQNQDALFKQYGIASDDDTSIVVDILKENKTVEYEFCDANENCTKNFTLPSNPDLSNFHTNESNEFVDISGTKITNSYNDTKAPEILPNITSIQRVDNLYGEEWLPLNDVGAFSDGLLEYQCAFITRQPYHGNGSYLNYLYKLFYNTYHGDASSLCAAEGTDDKLEYEYPIYLNSDFQSKTISEILKDVQDTNTWIKSGINNPYDNCLSYYLWFVGADSAKNVSFYGVTFHIGDQVEKCVGKSDEAPEIPEIDDCDALCQMKRNSEEWWRIYCEDPTSEALNELHEENQKLCINEVKNCWYDNGYWWTNKNTLLYEIDIPANCQ